MKPKIHLIVASSLSPTCSGLAQNYEDLAAQGYRWVTVDGPYACVAEQDVQQIVDHRSDATELQVVENVQCYYLVAGAIVQIVKEDPARGMSEIRFGSIISPLWTYTRFLSSRPVKDTYGVIETPENSGLVPSADTATVPSLPSNSSTARTLPNANP
jgi:hypothetical protein